MADLTIALERGFSAGEDVDYVVETMRGHNLGRIIREGSALPNTGIPGVIAGYGKERVIHAPAGGVIRCQSRIADIVEKDQDPGMDRRGTCKSQPYRSVERNHPGWCQDFGRNEDRRY